MPSTRLKPALHEHDAEPATFLHTCSHGNISSMHSSISENSILKWYCNVSKIPDCNVRADVYPLAL